jgi:excisionase family DNA binding protein
MDVDEFLDVDRASIVTGHTPPAQYKLVARGKIPYRKFGRKLLFKKSELLQFLDELPGRRPEEVRR